MWHGVDRGQGEDWGCKSCKFVRVHVCVRSGFPKGPAITVHTYVCMYVCTVGSFKVQGVCVHLRQKAGGHMQNMGCYASPSDPNTQQNRTQDLLIPIHNRTGHKIY